MSKPKCPDCGSEDYDVLEQAEKIHVTCKSCRLQLIIHLEGLKR